MILCLIFRISHFDDSASGVYICAVQYGQSSIEGFVNAKIFGL